MTASRASTPSPTQSGPVLRLFQALRTPKALASNRIGWIYRHPIPRNDARPDGYLACSANNGMTAEVAEVAYA